MTPDEINRAIAEKVGWRFVEVSADGLDDGCWLPPGALHDANVFEHCEKSPPRYSEDLNAMHEAEKAAFGSSTQWVDFAYHLLTVLQSADMSVPDGMTCLLQATAAQRAEAFLRTIGKWRDT